MIVNNYLTVPRLSSISLASLFIPFDKLRAGKGNPQLPYSQTMMDS